MFDRPEQTERLQDVTLGLLPGNMDQDNQVREERNHETKQQPPLVTSHDAYSRSSQDFSADNTTHPLRNSNATSSGWQVISEWYILEVIAVIASALTLCAMLGVLAAFDRKPQPSWKYMSLNSLISWLSTISKGSILFAINEALGQLKWVWFTQKTRPVPDIRSFDTASRGFWGSALLIWELRGRHLAVIGSMAVILGLALDPFAQNLVHYYEQMVVDPSQTALLTNSSLYNTTGSYFHGFFYVDPVLKANVYNSIFNVDQTKPWAVAQYACSTNNCTWDPTVSLEYQALCSNVSSDINITVTEATSGSFKGIPNVTLTLPGSPIEAWFMPDLEFNQPLVAVGIPAQDALIYKNGTTVVQYIAPYGVSSQNGSFGVTTKFNFSTLWQATECSLEPVVRSFNASVRNGNYQETTIATWNDRESNSSEVGYSLSPPWGSETGMQPNQSFFISFDAAEAIRDFVDEIFTGSVSIYFEYISYGNGIMSTTYAASDVIQTLAMGNITDCGYEVVDKLECSMNNAAAAISKTLRDSAYIASNWDQNPANMTVGQAMSVVTHVIIHWEWVVLSILVWILGTIMLIGTIWQTRRVNAPNWKNDPLPLLFLYQSEQARPLAEKDFVQVPSDLTVRLHGYNHDGMLPGGRKTERSRTYTFNR